MMALEFNWEIIHERLVSENRSLALAVQLVYKADIVNALIFLSTFVNPSSAGMDNGQ